jgi:hypothetical protein
MKPLTLVAFGLSVVLGIAGCTDHDTCCDPCDSDDLPITHVVFECVDEPYPYPLPQPVVTGVSYEDGKVALSIKFAANCCPGFATVGSAKGKVVEIVVVDTLAACRCTCMFEDAFIFEWPRPVWLGISFRFYSTSPSYVGRLDTTLTLR